MYISFGSTSATIMAAEDRKASEKETGDCVRGARAVVRGGLLYDIRID